MSDSTIKYDIDFLFELGTLRNIRRSWDQLSPETFENVTEHTFKTAWISIILSKYIKQKFNKIKLLLMAFSFNIYKTRCGDAHYISYINIKQNKEKAIFDSLKDTSQEISISELIKEYLLGDSIEAKIVYTSNILADILELTELERSSLEIAKIWKNLNQKYNRKVIKISAGKKLWKAIINSHPHNWHLSSKNRFCFKHKDFTPNNGIEGDIDFLYEISSLKFIQRNWVQFVGYAFSNLLEHLFRTVWLTIILSSYEKKINIPDAIITAMIHDLHEIRGCDVNYISSQYVRRDKQKAIKQTLKNTSIKKEILSFWKKFENQTSKEAKLVKDADSLEPILELKEQESLGVDITKTWLELNIKRLKKNLNTKTAKLFLKQIIKSNPHNWHLNAKNRFKSGWK